MRFLGIDPGKHGGVASISCNGTLVAAVPIPATARDLLDVLADLQGPPDDPHVLVAVIEHVTASPQMGVVSAFTFGLGYGALTMALTAQRIPFERVTPLTWQRAMRCLSKGDKNVTKRRAQELFPNHPMTHAIADAVLLAEYNRRMHTGTVTGP